MATQRKKKISQRRGASRGRKQSAPAHLWFLAGLLIGLSISGFLFLKGYLPEGSAKQPVASTTQTTDQTGLADDAQSIAGQPSERRFDFFTVLPEMEVIVPDQELSRNAQPQDTPVQGGSSDQYILQVGSFQNPSDAEQLKARLALLGNVANIQVVTVNQATWHRVRIGPVKGARRADEVRRMLQDNGIDTLVMKGSG
jgi:cell division protein FtsN